MPSEEKPYILFVAELIYFEILKIKKENIDFSNVDAIDGFIGTKTYKRVSSGMFHDEWFEELKKNNFVDQNTKKRIPDETIRLLQIQKDLMIKQLIQFPDLYYTKSHYPLEISQRAFDHLWRMCESYELWCKESKQNEILPLNIID